MTTPLSTNPPQPKRWRRLRRCLVGLAVCVTVIALFYTEELWRGKRDWENCKRALEAQGINFDWTAYIPASVPDDENVFGVPEMQPWFTGRGATDLSKKLSYPGLATSKTARLVLAELKIDLPGTSSDSGSNVLHWGDPGAQEQAARLIRDALGRVSLHPSSPNLLLMPRSPEEIHPAQILLQCQTAPTTNELLQFLPKASAMTDSDDTEQIQLEPMSGDSYKVTILAPNTVAEFLNWSEQVEPDFALIRKALQRPYSRMNGNYSVPYEIPIPNFITVRITAQTLSAMTRCHLLAGKPEEALRDLTLMHDLCRIDTNQPITLVGAMINAAVFGLYTATMADGLKWHAWREPQLAALEEQLRTINVLLPLQQSFQKERVATRHTLENTPPVKLLQLFMEYPPERKTTWTVVKSSVLGALLPRGWLYQNMVTSANLEANFDTLVDSANKIVFADKVESINEKAHEFSPRSPYAFMLALAVPNFTRAYQTTAHNQTLINQALVACALERFRLAYGQYPETLDALVPQFVDKIPHDVIGGQPPHYHRASDGTLVLYSVGWSGRDGGGVRGKTTAEGEWVWPD